MAWRAEEEAIHRKAMGATAQKRDDEMGMKRKLKFSRATQCIASVMHGDVSQRRQTAPHPISGAGGVSRRCFGKGQQQEGEGKGGWGRSARPFKD